MQAMFRPPLENIFGLRRPLLLGKETGLALVKRSTERTPEVADRLGVVQQALDSRPISPRIPVRDVLRKPGAPPAQFVQKEREVGVRNVSSRQCGALRPRSRHLRKVGGKLVQCVLREAAISGDL